MTSAGSPGSREQDHRSSSSEARVLSAGYMGWKHWDDNTFGICGVEQSSYYDLEMRASGIGSLSGLYVGELGFGNGEFAAWVRARGGKWIGREAIVDLQQRARAAGFEVIGANERFSTFAGSGALDLIVAFDVVEHLDQQTIRSFLTEANEALRPGGLLIFRTPSGDSPFSGAIYNGDLTHRSLLGSSAVQQLAMDAHLKVVQVRSPVLPIGGLGILKGLRRAAVLTVQAVLFFLIRNALMGRPSAVISPNMTVVLRKES